MTRLPNRVKIIQRALASGKGHEMYPNEDIKILLDNDYIMASLGVMSKEYPEAAFGLMENSLQLESSCLLINKEAVGESR